MNAYEKVTAARAKDRRTARDFINSIFTDFIEMHGDRRFGDDRAVITGLGMLGDTPCTVAGIEKGRGLKEKIAVNFGSAHPEGYRKSLRQFKLAEKFRRPVVCFIDTAGAFCGIGAEERGIGQAIAENLTGLIGLRVPVISILIGEGGSGGALALGVADEVWMLEKSFYSVISPEGCASILWSDGGRANEASEHLKLTAEDLLGLRVIERIIPEGNGNEIFDNIKTLLIEAIGKNRELDPDVLFERRYARYRSFGIYK